MSRNNKRTNPKKTQFDAKLSGVQEEDDDLEGPAAPTTSEPQEQATRPVKKFSIPPPPPEMKTDFDSESMTTSPSPLSLHSDRRPFSTSSSSGSFVSKIFGGSKHNSVASSSGSGTIEKKASGSSPPVTPTGKSQTMRSGSFVSFFSTGGNRATALAKDDMRHPRTSDVGAFSPRGEPIVKLDDLYTTSKNDDFEFGMRQGAHVFVPDNEPFEKAVTTVPEKGFEFQAKVRWVFVVSRARSFF